jgi:hypothetical protein
MPIKVIKPRQITFTFGKERFALENGNSKLQLRKAFLIENA